MTWLDKSKQELDQLRSTLTKTYEDFRAQNLNLDMTRGKPGGAQLDLAAPMLSLPGPEQFKSKAGQDCRNYGGLDGLEEAKAMFAPMLDANPSQLLIGGNASLTLMHDTVVRAMLFGVPGGKGPWLKQGPIKFLCPVPGYDRHFGILENLGIGMIPVPLNEHGPDMDVVQSLVAKDASIKGIFCVPKYSNPTGTVYSDDVIDALATMKTAAPDFRIFWDNAYAVHHLGEGPTPIKSILQACDAGGNPNRAFVFASTSKISFAGAGISFMAQSQDNLVETKKRLGKQTIGPDKLNILRHVQFFKNYDGILAHMDRHAAILKPKFDVIQSTFDAAFEGTGICTYTNPKGGYFVSLDTLPGKAKKTVKLAEGLGLKLTNAGATFPKGEDPEDRNIRIAPSLPPLEEVKQAMEMITVCIKLASLD